MKFNGENCYYRTYEHGDYKIIFSDASQFRRDFARVEILGRFGVYSVGFVVHEHARGFTPERYFLNVRYGAIVPGDLSALIIETYLKINKIIL